MKFYDTYSVSLNGIKRSTVIRRKSMKRAFVGALKDKKSNLPQGKRKRKKEENSSLSANETKFLNTRSFIGPSSVSY